MFNQNNKNKKRGFLFYFFSLLITKIISSRVMVILASNDLEIVPDPMKIPDLGTLFERIINAIFIIAITVLPLIFIWGAAVLMFSAGAPEKVQRGQKIMWYAGLGLLIILFARGIIHIIRHVIGA